MEISPAEMAELGARIKARRQRAFGTKKAAYQEANVNAATWDRAEAGEPIRGDRLRSIVRALWPESEGDWTAIGEHTGGADERVAELEQRIVALEKLVDFFRQQRDSTESGESSADPGVSA